MAAKIATLVSLAEHQVQDSVPLVPSVSSLRPITLSALFVLRELSAASAHMVLVHRVRAANSAVITVQIGAIYAMQPLIRMVRKADRPANVKMVSLPCQMEAVPVHLAILSRVVAAYFAPLVSINHRRPMRPAANATLTPIWRA